jgi:hypothetical protein
MVGKGFVAALMIPEMGLNAKEMCVGYCSSLRVSINMQITIERNRQIESTS